MGFLFTGIGMILATLAMVYAGDLMHRYGFFCLQAIGIILALLAMVCAGVHEI